MEREKALTPFAKSVQHFMLDSRTFLPLPGSEMVSCKLLKPSFCYLQTQRTNTCLKSFCEDERQVCKAYTYRLAQRNGSSMTVLSDGNGGE